MDRTAARIQVCIAFEDGTLKFVALHSSLVATSVRDAERLAVFAEGGSVKRSLTRLDTYVDGTPVWDVFLCANAKAARYWGPKAVAARLTAKVETATVETATVETATVETATVETATVETATVETATVETATVETVGRSKEKRASTP